MQRYLRSLDLERSGRTNRRIITPITVSAQMMSSVDRFGSVNVGECPIQNVYAERRLTTDTMTIARSLRIVHRHRLSTHQVGFANLLLD